MSATDSWLALLGPDLQDAGTAISRRGTWNMVGFTVEDDGTIVTITSSGGEAPAGTGAAWVVADEWATPGTLPAIYGGTGLSALGTALYYLRVNAAGTALEYVAPPAAVTSVTMGGDVSGSSGSATVAKVNGIACSGTPAAGAVLRATSASAAAWGAVDMADTDAVTGTLPIGNGGTGLAALGTALKVPRVNAAGTALEYVTPATVSGFQTALDFDFSAQANLTMATDTTYTFGGYTFTKINSANDLVAAAIVNGQGLVLRPNGSTTDYDAGNRSTPALYVPLAQVIPSFERGMRVRMWMRILADNIGANFDQAVMALEAGATMSYVQRLVFSTSRKQKAALNINSTGIASTPDDTTDAALANSDVFMLDVEIGGPFVRCYTGLWSGGWPAHSTLRFRDQLLVNSSTANNLATRITGTTAWNALLGAGRYTSGTALSVTFSHLKVEYKP